MERTFLSFLHWSLNAATIYSCNGDKEKIKERNGRKSRRTRQAVERSAAARTRGSALRGFLRRRARAARVAGAPRAVSGFVGAAAERSSAGCHGARLGDRESGRRG